MTVTESQIYSVETFQGEDPNVLDDFLRGVMHEGVIPLVERHELGVTVVSRTTEKTREQLVSLGRNIGGLCTRNSADTLDEFIPEADILSRYS